MVHFGSHVKTGVLQNLISTGLQSLKGYEAFPAGDLLPLVIHSGFLESRAVNLLFLLARW